MYAVNVKISKESVKKALKEIDTEKVQKGKNRVVKRKIAMGDGSVDCFHIDRRNSKKFRVPDSWLYRRFQSESALFSSFV